MAEGTHLIVTVEDERGFSAQSPQLPGFVMGRQTEAEFRRDYLEVLRDLAAELPIIGHRQWRYETPEGPEDLVRLGGEPQGGAGSGLPSAADMTFHRCSFRAVESGAAHRHR